MVYLDVIILDIRFSSSVGITRCNMYFGCIASSVLFTQNFPNGAELQATSDKQGVSSSFPAINVPGAVPLGYVSRLDHILIKLCNAPGIMIQYLQIYTWIYMTMCMLRFT